MKPDRPSRAEIERILCDVVARTLSIPRGKVRPSSRLYEDLAPESLDLVQLGMAIEEAFPGCDFDLDPSGETIFSRRLVTLSDIALWIDRTWNGNRP